VEVCGPHTTGVVIRERFDTAPPPGSDAVRAGRTGRDAAPTSYSRILAPTPSSSTARSRAPKSSSF
jgi:hypothetical protein